MAQHGHLTSKEKKEIRVKRRALRKDLKRRGIRSKAEFEVIAQQLGLVYGNSHKFLLPFWRFLDKYGLWALAALLLAILLALAIIYGISALNKAKEDYTIALSGNLQKIGLELSETEDFKNPKVRLNATPVTEVNAMSVQSLPEGLDDAEGAHNGKNYLAYTFWIRNSGEVDLAYDWQVQMLEESTNVGDAIWMMIFDDGKNVIYARAPKGAAAEKLLGYTQSPQQSTAMYPEAQYYEKNGKKGVRTTPFLEDRIVTNGTEYDFEVGEKHKYTVVMWVEGDDPECTNDNFGGVLRFAFKFAVHVDEDSEDIFDDFIFEEGEYIKNNDPQGNNLNPDQG